MSKLTNAEFNKDFHFREVQSCFDCQHSIFSGHYLECVHARRIVSFQIDSGTYAICSQFEEEI